MRIALDARERQLLLKYGYPFEELQKELVKHRKVIGTVDLQAPTFEWEQAVGNLSISINEDVEDRMLLEELDALASLIEFALR